MVNVKMKKQICTLGVLMLLVLALVSAVVDYEGAPTLPYLIYGEITYNGVGIGGATLTIKNENTLFTKTIITDSQGYWQEDSSNWQTSSPYRPPIQGDDTITVTYGNQVKTFKVYEDGNLGGFAVNFEATEAPPEPEPEEPIAVTKVTSNEDSSLALIEAYYGDDIEIVIQDNKLDQLIDSEIEFEGEDYNVHEEILLIVSLKTSLYDDRYGLSPYLIIPEEGITYKYVFDDVIPKGEVDRNDPLEIRFLGKDIEIVKITDTSIIIRSGTAKTLVEGQSYKGVTLDTVYDDSVKVTYNGESNIVHEGDIEDLGDIQIEATEIANDEDFEGIDSAKLRIAEDIELSISNGDDYDDEEVYKWIITANSIGITNQNQYEDLEEEYLPLKEGDSIVLPNDYATITFNKVTTSEVTTLDIDVKDEYLRIRGDRDDSFADEYDEIYVDANGIYDENKVLISSDKVRIGESDIYLELGSIKIGDLTIELDMSDIKYKGISLVGEDESYLDLLGIIFKDPDDAIIDKRDFEVIVPDERPEASISIKVTIPEEEEDEDVVITPPVIDDEEDEEEIAEPPVTPPVTPPVEPPIVIDDEEDENTVWEALQGLIVKILAAFGFGAGFIGLLRYWWRHDKKRAIKMAQTAIGRALSGQYDKYKKE